MSRELRRVPLDFTWPLDKTWTGYINDRYTVVKCDACDGSGSSPAFKRLTDQWYGYIPFRPEDRGSKPFTAETPEVLAFAKRNQKNSPSFYGYGEEAIVREANRLVEHWNGQWHHHLNSEDVNALVAAGRLHDFTHTWSREAGWVEKSPKVIPTADQVNRWSLGGMGHDGINMSIVVNAEAKRLGVEPCCKHCDGEGSHWPSQEAKDAYEAWEKTEPPTGDAYQIWETVGDGAPISPPFATPRELARYMVKHPWGADRGSSFDTWMRFIEGPGWAPSMMSDRFGRMVDGVTGMVDLNNDH